MLDWLRRLRAPSQPPLRGAPPVRRHKTYTADTGYVYTYYYEGYRETAAGYDFHFQSSANNDPFAPVLVTLARDAVRRQLTDTERYALAKLSLFQAFDERPLPSALRAPILIRPADAQAILERLGWE